MWTDIHIFMTSDDSAKEQKGESLTNDLVRTRHNTPKDEGRPFLNIIYKN